MITHKSMSLLTSGKASFLNDGRGLIAKRLPSGTIVWVARKMANGKRQSVTLGKYPEVGIAEAREKARAFLSGIAAQEAPKAGDTVRDVFEWWYDRHAPMLRDPGNIKTRLAAFLDAFGPVRFSEMDQKEVLRFFEEYTEGGTKRLSGARKIIGYVKMLEKIAVTLGHAPHRRLEGLNLLIPPATPKPMASVTPEELPGVLRQVWAVRQRGRILKDLLMTGLYTLLRPGEYRKMEWGWVDFDEAVITVPAETMKMGKEHRVPASVQLMDLLRRRLEGREGDFVFHTPGDPLRPVSENAMGLWFRRHGLSGRLTPHGIRSTGRSWMADSGIAYEVAELCLAHEVGSNIERRYNRTDLFDRRRAAMQAWSDYVEQCLREATEGDG